MCATEGAIKYFKRIDTLRHRKINIFLPTKMRNYYPSNNYHE